MWTNARVCHRYLTKVIISTEVIQRDNWWVLSGLGSESRHRQSDAWIESSMVCSSRVNRPIGKGSSTINSLAMSTWYIKDATRSVWQGYRRPMIGRKSGLLHVRWTWWHHSQRQTCPFSVVSGPSGLFPSNSHVSVMKHFIWLPINSPAPLQSFSFTS